MRDKKKKMLDSLQKFKHEPNIATTIKQLEQELNPMLLKEQEPKYRDRFERICAVEQVKHKVEVLHEKEAEFRYAYLPDIPEGSESEKQEDTIDTIPVWSKTWNQMRDKKKNAVSSITTAPVDELNTLFRRELTAPQFRKLGDDELNTLFRKELQIHRHKCVYPYCTDDKCSDTTSVA